MILFSVPAVQQMIGRAGRPGFDLEGRAIIMTQVAHIEDSDMRRRSKEHGEFFQKETGEETAPGERIYI